MRLTAAACLAAVALVGVAAPASAGTSAVSASNWYYDDPGLSTSAAAQQATPTTVPKGDLGVGYRRGTPTAQSAPVGIPFDEADKITALAFDLTAAPAGSTVTSFTFSLPVDTAGDPMSAALVGGQPPAIVACLSNRTFTPAPGPSPYLQTPSYDCGTKAAGKYDAATSSYDFTVTPLAQAWVDGSNTGLVVIPDPGNPNPTPFTLSFTTKITADVKITAAAPAVTATPVATAAPTSGPAVTSGPVPVAPTTRGVSGSLPDPAPVSGPTAVIPPADTGTLTAPVPAATEAVPAPAVAGNESTGGAAQQPAVAPASNAAATDPVHVGSGFGWPVWILIALVLVGGLAALSLGLAGPEESTAGRTSRLTHLLQQHRP